MKTVTKTYEDMINFVNLLNFNVQEGTTKGQKKLAKISERFKVYVEEYNEAVQDLRLDNAVEDEQKRLVLDDKGGYTFTKEGIRNFNKQSKELRQKPREFKVVEVVNPAGLEQYTFLKDWVTGVNFIETEDEDI